MVFAQYWRMISSECAAFGPPIRVFLHLLLRGWRQRPEEVPLLPPDKVEGVEATMHVVEGPELVQGVRDHQVVEAFAEQDLRKR